MKKLAVSMLVIGSLVMSGCGDGRTGTIPIGGILSGLDCSDGCIDSDLELELVAEDGVETLVLYDNGAFTFYDELEEGETFAVAIAQQPEGQMCVVTPANGEAEGNNIANIVVQCVTLPQN